MRLVCRSVGFDEPAELTDHCFGVSGQSQMLELGHLTLKPFRIGLRAWKHPQDARGRHRLRGFVRPDELLVESLARAGPDECDRNLGLWYEPGQPNQIASEIQDP